MSPTWECRLCNVGGSGGIDAFERHYAEHQREAVAAQADSDKLAYTGSSKTPPVASRGLTTVTSKES